MPMIAFAGMPGINVVRTGPRGGTPIVLLHPVGLDLTWWDQVFAAFGDEFDVAAFDLPGHGLSQPLATAPSFDVLAGVLEGVVAHLGAGPAHVVGLSVGGMIAQTFALARPDLVRTLTLVGTLCTFADAVRAALRERARVAREQGMAALVAPTQERWFPAAFRARRPDVLDRAATCMLAQDGAFYGAMWDMIAGLDLVARLPALSMPTLVMTGAEDGNAPPAAARQIAGLIAGAVVHELPGAGHIPQVETPAAFNSRLRAFLATAQ